VSSEPEDSLPRRGKFRILNDYSIWNCCFARGELPVDFMGGVMINSNAGHVETPMAFSIIATAPGVVPRRVIAVDTGFEGGRSMTGNYFKKVETIPTVLAKLGYTPDDIDVVVLTHLHFDHAGNFNAFPNAEIIVQRVEFESWKSEIAAMEDTSIGKRSWKLSSIDVSLIERFDAAVVAGRITLLDGDKEIAPGIFCRLAKDSHTFGSQWVEIQTPAGPYVCAGDVVYWYMNIERMWPPGYVQGNAWNLVRIFEQLRDLVGPEHLDHIVPGHDLEIYKRHPTWTVGENPIAEIHLAAGERSRCKEPVT
jgi:glyoxylase-like metal-dependent hydrolase (beta-lactamase superfamily II)